MRKLLPLISLCMCCGFADEQEMEEIQGEEIALLEPTFYREPSVPPTEFDTSSLNFIPRSKSPLIAASLSGIFPGLGHIYLGDYTVAGSLLGSTGLFAGLTYLSDSASLHMTNVMAIQNTQFYGIYAAYRDARHYNEHRGYSYKMPTDSFVDLVWAPFQWSVLKKPEVWGGYLGALSIGAALGYFVFSHDTESQVSFSTEKTLFPLLAFPVGIGEESFFRGFLQSAISEGFNPWVGIVASSLGFGGMHTFNAVGMEPETRKRYFASSIPFITTFGAYFGWLTYKNRSLKEAVALHSWYDFTLFLISYAAVQSAVGTPSCAISIPF